MNGKQRYFGSFKVFDEAVEYRDYCIQHNWSPDCIKHKKTSHVYYNKQRDNWIVQKYRDGKIQHFGSFDEYDDAMRHRDYCVSHNWSDDCKLNPVGKPNPNQRISKMFHVDIVDLKR